MAFDEYKAPAPRGKGTASHPARPGDGPEPETGAADAAGVGDDTTKGQTIRHAFLAGKEQAFEEAKRIVWDTASTGEAHVQIANRLMTVHRVVAALPDAALASAPATRPGDGDN